MYLLNAKIRLTMLCLSGFELYSRWVPLSDTYYAWAACSVCSLNSQISPASKNRTPIPPGRPVESLIMGIAMCFVVGNFFESFRFCSILRALRKLDDYVLRGERE